MTHFRRPSASQGKRTGKHEPKRRQYTPLRLEMLENRELLSITQSFQDGVQVSTGTYSGTQDARIVSTVPTSADYGGPTALRTDGTPDQAILLKWDLSNVAAGSKVESAALSLNVTDPSRDSYEIYALKRDWKEGATTWNSTGLGANWQVAGANGSLDRGSKVLGTVNVSAAGIATIQLNADGIAQVQAWIDNPASNYGIVIQDYGADDGLAIDSSEASTMSVRPKLTITYASGNTTTPPPDPTTPPDSTTPPSGGSGTTETKTFQNGTNNYNGTQDTRLRASYANTNYGGTVTLRVDGVEDDAALLKWDLSDIPAGSKIQSASLKLYISDPTRSTYEIYQMKRDWSESTSTWKLASTGTAWQTAGAQGSSDRGTTVLGTLTAGANGTVTINFNDAGIAVIQSWIDNPSSNYGFVIQDYSGTDGVGFCSSEHSKVAYRPALTVSYTTGDGGATEPPPTGTTNKAPVVDAGSNQTVPVSGTVNLNGTVTDDGLPTPSKLTTTWSKVSGPGTVTFGNAAAVDTTARFSTPGAYVLQLLASDGSLKTTDTVTITVTSSETPQPVQGFFVSPNGSSKGNGSLNNPWDLQTALSQPAAVKAGSTIYLRGGTYRGGFVSTLTGTASAPITVAAYPGEHVIIDSYKPGNTGNPLFQVKGDYSIFQGIEFMSSDPSSRITTQSGSHPSNINRGGLYNYGDYNKFINLVVHDLNTGIGLWSEGKGGEVYGCIIYNNGWIGSDRTHGHGIYTQNKDGTKLIADNIIFNQFDYGLHAYGSQNAYLNNYDVQGNTIFNNGAGSGVGYRRQPDILIGGAVAAQNITLKNNYTYQNGKDGAVYLGYSQVNKDLTLKDNYFVSDLSLRGGWTKVNASGNTVIGKTNKIVEMEVPPGVSPSSYQWNNNHYVSAASTPFSYEGSSKTWSQWKSTTRLDSNSDFTAGTPTGTKVFVQPNDYEAGRANITVYNWDLKSSVSVDLSSVLTVGAKYEIHNPYDMFGKAIVSGIYDGKPISIPMTTRTAPSPIGYSAAAPVGTSPEFGVFVVTSTGGSASTAKAATMSATTLSVAAPAAKAPAETLAAPASPTATSTTATPAAETSSAPTAVARSTATAAQTDPPAVAAPAPTAANVPQMAAESTAPVQEASLFVPPAAQSAETIVSAEMPTPASESSQVAVAPAVSAVSADTTPASSSDQRLSKWSQPASQLQRLQDIGQDTSASSSRWTRWQDKLAAPNTTGSASADSTRIGRLRDYLDQLHDRIDTPQERQALAEKIEARIEDACARITPTIDAVLASLNDTATDLKADLEELYLKLAEHHSPINRSTVAKDSSPSATS